MSNPQTVRVVGGSLLLLAIPSVFWGGWFFESLGFLLAASGAWRLCFPVHSIRVQRKAYPRWVHGCLLLVGAIVIWVLKP